MPKAKSVFKSGRGLRVGAALTDDLGSLREHELGFKDGALYSRIGGEIVKVLGGQAPALIPAGSSIVYPMMGGTYTVVAEDGSEYRYGLTVDGEEPIVRMQTDAVPKFIFTIPVEKDSSGTWQDVSEDEGDLLGVMWATVSDIAGVSHNLPVQGTEIVRVQMGDGWADVQLGSGDGRQVAQVVAFSDDLRPGMAEFMESFGISGDLLDVMLSEGIPIEDTPLASSVHIEDPIHIVFVTIADRAYRTARIGNQEWLAENLDVEIGSLGADCFMYNNDPVMRAKYGLLYKWTAICDGNEKMSEALSAVLPEGWRLPSKSDLEMMLNTVGGNRTAGPVLKSTTDWAIGGTDDYGLTVLPAASWTNSRGFYGLGTTAGFWTSTEHDSSPDTDAYYCNFYTGDNVAIAGSKKSNAAYSVRLVRDVT